MRLVWICAIFLSFFVEDGYSGISKPQPTKQLSPFASDDKPGDDNKSEPLRIKNELNELRGIFDDYTQANHDNTLGLKSQRTVNSIKSFSSSCPPYGNAHGIYTVNVIGLPPFPVLCNTNLAGPGWTVIASRTTGDLNFLRKWEEYKQGFGSLSNEFFIGLEKLHAITASQPHELYIHLEDFSGNKRFARYDDFLVGTEEEKYAMKRLGSYSGDAGDSLSSLVKMKFTTFDNDNDLVIKENCAILRKGAWWYSRCSDSNLFGLYLGGNYDTNFEWSGMGWDSWLGLNYSYKVVHMLIRPRSLSPDESHKD